MRCDSLYMGLPCTRDAVWLVQVGTRKTDAAGTCAKHLNQTCQTMHVAEDRERVQLTLTPVTKGQTREDVLENYGTRRVTGSPSE
jgi:predicted kinase